MKTYEEIKDQLDVEDPISKEVFLALLTNLWKISFEDLKEDDTDAIAKITKAKNLFIIEMRKRGFLGPTECLFYEKWLFLYLILVSHKVKI